MKKFFTLMAFLCLCMVNAMAAKMADDAESDGDLVEIEQTDDTNLPTSGDQNRAAIEKCDGYTQYTFNGNISVAFKMLNVDVEGCDKIIIKFAEPTPAGMNASFESASSTGSFEVAEGITDLVVDLSDSKKCSVVDGKLGQICLLTIYNNPGKIIKVKGVYKHKGEIEEPAAPEEPGDPKLPNEIKQSRGFGLDDFTRTDFKKGEEYNTYTAKKDLQVAMKMMKVDVKGCDYITIKFAEAVKSGWVLGVYKDTKTIDIPAGTTEFKYEFAQDEKCEVADGILPQICFMTLWGGSKPLEAKVVGIYKHTAEAQEYPGTKVSADKKFATFISPVDVTLPSGIDAYTCEKVDDDALVLAPVNGGLKANTACILHNTTDADVAVGPTTGIGQATKGKYTTGLLTGVYVDVKAPEGSYILQKKGENVGFYKCVDETYSVKASRCYLTLPTDAAKSLSFIFSDGTTGVPSLDASEAGAAADGKIYDINGIERARLEKGVNIINGVKVIVK